MSDLSPDLIKAILAAPPLTVACWFGGRALLKMLESKLTAAPVPVDQGPLVQVVQQNTEAMSRLVDVLNRMERDQRESAKDMFNLLRDMRDRVLYLESVIPELHALMEQMPAELRTAVDQIIRAMPKTA